MAGHRKEGKVPPGTGAKGPGVRQHRRVMARADRHAAIAALLLLALGFGLMGYLLLTIPTGAATTP